MDQCLIWNAWSFLKNLRKQKDELFPLKNRYGTVYNYRKTDAAMVWSGSKVTVYLQIDNFLQISIFQLK